ncbi:MULTISPECIES: copper resistance CopC/CopD family protein [Nocardia]|uniref:copper resistance CopC/CopD family protein n=1 Tax=Nocardia TaxID=1817 RepID=UPI000D693D5F|nr:MULTISPECIES: copper resistance protein CopC [Nocardia]
MSRVRSVLPWLFVFLVVTASSMWAAGAASAHAGLESTSPANGTHTDKSPGELLLRLNEPVTLVEGSAQLIDSGGERCGLADVRLDDGQRSVVLVPADVVPDGAYLATARVVSADTHVVSLSIQFTVGSVTEQGQFSDDTAAGFEQYLNYPSKGISYLGLVMSAGLFASARWVWPTATGLRRFRVTYRVGAGLAIVGLLSRFAVLAAQQSGGLSQVSASSARTLLATPHGLATAVAVTLSAAALAPPGRRHTPLLVAQAIAAVLAVSLGGHGGSVQGWPWSFLGTVIHVYGITVWLGGVAVIVLVHRGVPELRRWHAVAVAHVAVAVAGGLLLTFLQVRPLAALLETTYGLVLVGKVLGATVVAGLGYGAYRRSRRVGADTGAPRLVALETGLAVAVLAATSVLTTLPPAKDTYTTDLATTLDFGSAEILHVDIDSVRRGPQRLTIEHPRANTTARRGDSPAVSVDLSSASANVARLPVRLTDAVEDNGTLVWRSDQLIVPAPGEWKVTVRFDGGHGPKLASFYYRAL